MSDERAGSRPVKVVLPPGTYAVCCCGRTARPPHCDGSHAGTGRGPVEHRIEGEPFKLAWCTCRTSGSLPFCDGSHRRVAPSD